MQKNAKKIGIEKATLKTTKNEAKKLYNELIQKDIDALEWGKSDDIRKYNILDILNNLGSIFTGTYLHNKDVPIETMFEGGIKDNKINKRKIWWN